MRSTVLAAVVVPVLTIAGLWGLLTFDPVRSIRDRLSYAGAAAEVDLSHLYSDPQTQEITRGAYPLGSLRQLESGWCGAGERVRFVLVGNSQTMSIVLAPSEVMAPYPDKTYPNLMLDALRSSGASVRGYRLSAPNINYMEVLWYLTYLLSHHCLTPTDLIVQLNFETFRKTGIRDGMLELLGDRAFATAAEAEAAATGAYAGTLRQAIGRYRTRLATTTGVPTAGAAQTTTGVAETRGLGGVLETRVRQLLDQSRTFRSRSGIKGEFVTSLYVARVRWLNISASTRRSVAPATLTPNVAALERIGELCRQHGIRLTLFNAPQNPLVPLYQTDADRDNYHRVIAGIETRYAWRSFDFEDSMSKELWGVWIDGPDPIHLGRAGQKRLAELMLGAGVIPRN